MYLTHNCIIMLSLLANKLPPLPLLLASFYHEADRFFSSHLRRFPPVIPLFLFLLFLSLSFSIALIFLRLVDLVRNYSKMLEATF